VMRIWSLTLSTLDGAADRLRLQAVKILLRRPLLLQPPAWLAFVNESLTQDTRTGCINPVLKGHDFSRAVKSA
jgi:hypothetical protein